MLRLSFALTAGVLLASCAHHAATPPASEVLAFSANRPGDAVPRGWQPWIINRTKAKTDYELVVDPRLDKVVLHARAQKSASGLAQRLDVDPLQRPRIAWDWRVEQLIAGADNTDRDAEDAPVRLMLFFDGDKSQLPVREQVLMDTARMLTGRELPYATLMYVWENRQPVGTVIPNSYTGQVKMVVAGSGADQLGQWKRLERDYVDDYVRAFGQAPGRLIGIGILSDTDNTGETVEAYYGDVRLMPPSASTAASATAAASTALAR